MNDSTSLLLLFAENDSRICFAYSLKEKRFVYQNTAFKKFFDVPERDCTIDYLFSRVHIDDRELLINNYKALRAKRISDTIEFRIERTDNKTYTMLIRVLLDKPKKEQGTVLGFIEDITSIRDHENKLKDLSNKKNAILNILSHDLAGPLGSIQHYTYVLQKKTQSLQDKDVQMMISSVERISKRSIQMIQEFLRLEFIESVGVDAVKKRENLTGKMETFMREYLQTQDHTGKSFVYETTNNHIYVELDENKFMQVVNNLISNALKFTPNGGTIRVNLEDKEDTVILSVSDTGIGIPRKYHDKLFDKFSQARRTGLKGEPSVGLGMSIIKTIVEWHRGKIWFESEENKGSTFFVELAKCD